MAAAQPAYDYASYDYGCDPNAAAGYSTYPGYETSASYPAPTGYEGYAASGAYHAGAPTAAPYAAVDPYSGYPATAYAYPPAGPSAAAASQAAYPPGYTSSPSTAAYPYDARRGTPPPPTAAPTSAHYSGYEYGSSAPPGAYALPAASAATYSPYKTAPTANGATAATGATSIYPGYPPSGPAAHGSYAVPSAGHLGGPLPPPPGHHVYGAPPPGGSAAAGPPPGAPIMSRRPDYYPPASVAQPMHYVPHPPQSLPYRLPPRGGYQRELDEPGDENALLRHVIYITGLPKEIQNETLAEVFGAACGPIAPVDVRSPKPKIWVYKDRQTREGKGEATITFISPESAQTAISYYNGRELFGREIRVTLCPRRMYNMQKQNTPFNPGAAPISTTTPIASMVKAVPTNNNTNGTAVPSTSVASASTISITTSTAGSSTTSNSTPSTTTSTTAPASSSSTTTTTPTSSSVTGANPIATISSSTHGLPRQLNHSLIKIRQTPEQQRGLLPTPPMPYGAPMMGGNHQRDGVRKELPRVALTRGNYANPAGVRPKPY